MHEESVLRIRDGGGSITDSLDTGSVGSLGSTGSVVKPTSTQSLMGESSLALVKPSWVISTTCRLKHPRTLYLRFQYLQSFLMKPPTVSTKSPQEWEGTRNIDDSVFACEGLFNEVERGSRMMLGLKSVDEGGGMLNLVKAYCMHAEMYKNMGLWVLALALYLDSMDTTILLWLPADTKLVSYIIQCLLKMRCTSSEGIHRSAVQTYWAGNMSTDNFKSSKHYYEADKSIRKVLITRESVVENYSALHWRGTATS